MTDSNTALTVRPFDQRPAALIAMAGRKPMQILDVRAPNGVVELPVGRFDALATISAGERGPAQNNRPGYPQAVKDGRICLHDEAGRAPGLKQALEETGYKSLTVAFPGDDESLFLQQRFAAYTQTALLAYGDASGIYEIIGEKENAQHVFRAPGTPEFRAALDKCKVTVSVYFHLAEWDNDLSPRVVFPDGLGLYRLRFTSRNSLRNILASLDTIRRYTGGKVAGLPLELSISYREVSGPDGAKRKIAVWQCLLKPPRGQVLDSRTFREIANAGIAEAEALMLPAPEDMQDALRDGPVTDLDEAVVENIAAGGTCSYDYWIKRFHATVKGTDLATDGGRRDFLAMYTNGETDSLADFLKTASEDDAAAMLQVAEAEMQSVVVTDAVGNVIDASSGEIVAEAGGEIVLSDLGNQTDDALKKHMTYLKKFYPDSTQRGAVAAEWKRRYPAENRAPRAPAPEPVVLDQPATPGVMTNGPKAPATGPNLHQSVRSVVAGSTEQSAEDRAEADALFGGGEEVSEGEVVEGDAAEAALMAAQPSAPAEAPATEAPATAKVKKRDAVIERLAAALDAKGFDHRSEDGQMHYMLMLGEALEGLHYARQASFDDIPTGQLLMVTSNIENGTLDPAALLQAALDAIDAV